MIRTKINNHILEFDEESHLYVVDGVIVPSVTQVLDKKYRDYQNIDTDILQGAADYGTALHSAIEKYEKDGEESDIKEFKNYLFLKNIYGMQNLKNEIFVLYEEDGDVLFAGRLDQVMQQDGKKYINDFKCVCTPNKEKIGYQLNMYKMAYEQSYNEQIDGLSYMQLKKDKRKWQQMPVNEEMTKKEIWRLL